MGKRPRRTPAEKARAQYTNYAVKEPMELMEFLTAKMPDASRTKLKSLLSKRVVLVDNVITTQFNFPLKPGMKVQISKDKGRKEFNNRLLKIVYEDAYIIVVKRCKDFCPSIRNVKKSAQPIPYLMNMCNVPDVNTECTLYIVWTETLPD